MVVNSIWLKFDSAYKTSRAKGRLRKAGLLNKEGWNFYMTTMVLDLEEPTDFNEVKDLINELLKVALPTSVTIG